MTFGSLAVATSSQRNEVTYHVQQRLHGTAAVLRSFIAPIVSDLSSEAAEESSRAEARQQLQHHVERIGSETDVRLTVVDSDGEVLAESHGDPDSMLNHANREELIDAAAHGRGTAIRDSPTLGVEMLYVALPIDEESGALVRAAVPVSTINNPIAEVQVCHG